MVKSIHNGRRKAAKTVAHKAMAGRSASVMKPEILALVENFRLMDDNFMSKCLENAPECIELILQIILDKKDLKVVKSQTEYPIKSLQGRGVRFDVFARDSKGREYDIEIQRANDGAEPKRARYNSALMDANALLSGDDVGKLRDAYVIFITETDVMGDGLEVYAYAGGLCIRQNGENVWPNPWRRNAHYLRERRNAKSVRDRTTRARLAVSRCGGNVF